MPHRMIDVPLESLPFIDEHFIDVAASNARVWEALLDVLAAGAEAPMAPAFARALGCAQTESKGTIGRIGSTIPGFIVARSVRPAVLALMGQHRFARYALIFSILEKPSGIVLLSAQSRGEFPALRGRLYRAGVIGTRAHVVITKRTLRRVRKGAERVGVTVGEG